MKGVAFLILGWLMMAPFSVYEGSKHVAKAPLGTDGDGEVRWVARALDPASREVTYQGKKYWYFGVAPTIEVRVFRDTKRSVELTSFEIVEATNVDSADSGQRIGDEPIEIKKTHAFEVWPDDESKPISFRFKGTYRSGSKRSNFGGTVTIDSVYPHGLEDPDSVESVPVAEALQAAKRGASFSAAQGNDSSVADAKARRRQRIAAQRSERRERLAQQRQARQQQRSQNRQQQRALAGQIDQSRKEMHRKYEADRARQKQAEARRRREIAESKRRAEERKQALREFEENQRKQQALAQQEAQQERAQQQRQSGYQPVRPGKKKSGAKIAKLKPQKVTIGLTPQVVESPKKSTPNMKQDEYATAEIRMQGDPLDCGPCEREVLCPWGARCAMAEGCYPIENCTVKKQKVPSGSSNSSSDSSESSDTSDPNCPGVADHRRLPQGTCLSVTAEWDKCYDDRPKLRLKIRNQCNMRVYMGWSLKTSGQFDHEGASGVRAGDTKNVSTCGATGDYSLRAVFSPKPMKDWVCDMKYGSR